MSKQQQSKHRTEDITPSPWDGWKQLHSNQVSTSETSSNSQCRVLTIIVSAPWPHSDVLDNCSKNNQGSIYIPDYFEELPETSSYTGLTTKGTDWLQFERLPNKSAPRTALDTHDVTFWGPQTPQQAPHTALSTQGHCCNPATAAGTCPMASCSSDTSPAWTPQHRSWDHLPSCLTPPKTAFSGFRSHSTKVTGSYTVTTFTWPLRSLSTQDAEVQRPGVGKQQQTWYREMVYEPYLTMWSLWAHGRDASLSETLPPCQAKGVPTRELQMVVGE